MPQHQVSHNETYTDSLIRQFEEVNEHFDNAINGMHLFSLTTDISTNETFTYHTAMKEKDRMQFIQAMAEHFSSKSSMIYPKLFL